MTIPTTESLPFLLQSIQTTLRREYTKEHSDPWLIAYSGGKDSTLLLQLAWETLVRIHPDQRRRPIYVVANDTLVESPVVIDHLRRSLQKIRDKVEDEALPIFVRVTRPAVDQTFWVKRHWQRVHSPHQKFPLVYGSNEDQADEQTYRASGCPP